MAYPTTIDLFSNGLPKDYVTSPNITESIAPTQQTGGNWLSDAFGGLVNTAVNAGQSALSSWASGQVAKNNNSVERTMAAGTGTTQQAGILGTLTSNTGIGVMLIVGAVVTLLALLAVTRPRK